VPANNERQRMKNLLVKPNKELTAVGGAMSFLVSLLAVAVLAIPFFAVRAAFDALPIWVIVISLTLLTVGGFISHRLESWKWLIPAVFGWIMSSFVYFLGASSTANNDPSAMWDLSGLGVMLLSGSMLVGSAASVLMPLALRSIQNEKLQNEKLFNS
jgi:hypothetical protein